MRGESRGRALARAALCPSVNAAKTLFALDENIGHLDLAALVAQLDAEGGLAERDLPGFSREMLTVHALTVDRVFHDLLERAGREQQLLAFDALMRLAIRTQSACRATLEASRRFIIPRLPQPS